MNQKVKEELKQELSRNLRRISTYREHLLSENPTESDRRGIQD